MGITIEDVAARAGVSTATVSRVLARSPKVRPETRAAVQLAISDLNYRPSGVARSLRNRRTASIGLIVTDITNPFYPELVRGAEDSAHRSGYSVILCNAAGDPERETEYLDVMLERRVDAVIVASGGLTSRQAEWLADFPVPVVLANVESPDGRLPAVVSDDRAGGRMALGHLQELGYQRFVHVAGPADAERTSLRLEGMRDIASEELEVVNGDGTLEGGRAAMAETLERVEPPIGVAAHNDMSAIGALATLARHRVAVPEQVGVVGFDDIVLSAYTSPPLTTVAQDKYGMGLWAFETAQRLLSGEELHGTHTLPVRLLVRGSTVPGA